MTSSTALFASAKPVIAMIHVGALPGTPASGLGLGDLEKQALREPTIFRNAGVQGLLLENMPDTPHLRGGVGPEIVAALAIIVRALKQTSGLPGGIQILAGGPTPKR
jgi:predicted TIM-barrel enzyme